MNTELFHDRARKCAAELHGAAEAYEMVLGTAFIPILMRRAAGLLRDAANDSEARGRKRGKTERGNLTVGSSQR